VYDAERADARALDQLEAVLREVAEELATWRARALKAEGDQKGRGSAPRVDGDGRRVGELEVENRQLRARVDAARTRVQDLLSRLAFLEEQSREVSGSSGASSGGAAR
jgi:cell division protein FtsB